MTKTEYAAYRSGEHWQNKRKQILSLRDFCERCGIPRWLARIVFDQDLHVHHRNYENLGNEEDSQLEVLCRRCHEVETFGYSQLIRLETRRCATCNALHYDPYSELCPTCNTVIGTEFLCAETDQHGDLWKHILMLVAEACRRRGVEKKEFVDWAADFYDYLDEVDLKL